MGWYLGLWNIEVWCVGLMRLDSGGVAGDLRRGPRKENFVDRGRKRCCGTLNSTRI